MEIKLISHALGYFLLYLTILWCARSDQNSDGMNYVLMVDQSNKCRSPISAAVFNIVAKSRGLDSRWYADSAALSSAPPHSMDEPSLVVLRTKYGIELSNLTKRLNDTDFDKFDYMLGMDEYSVEYLQSAKFAIGMRRPPKGYHRIGNKTKIELLTLYDPERTTHVMKKGCTRAEYWYQVSNRSCHAFLDNVTQSS